MAVTSTDLDEHGQPVKARRVTSTGGNTPPPAAPQPTLQPARPSSKPRPIPVGGCVEWIGWIGLYLGVAAFAGVIWAINGGYSVRGLQVIAYAFNEAGVLAWAWISALQFQIPVGDLPGISELQPVIPWAGVVAASLLQTSVLTLRILHQRTPPALVVAAGLFSLYDYGTTFFGLETAAWLQDAPFLFVAIFGLILSFIIEIIASFLIGKAVEAMRNRRGG